MKSAGYIITIVSLWVLAPGLSQAGEPPSQTSEKESRENQAPSVRPADPAHGDTVLADPIHSKVNADRRIGEQSSKAGPMSIPIKQQPSTPPDKKKTFPVRRKE
jgi:hypothetical protein